MSDDRPNHYDPHYQPRFGWMHAYHIRRARSAAWSRRTWIEEKRPLPERERFISNIHDEAKRHARLAGEFALKAVRA